jgi:AcrR family transcriptional regulator
MAILDDEKKTELVGGMMAARSVAHELVGEQLERSRQRLRSSSKTKKSVLTRKRIMDAASELMAERGGTSFQIGEVSERCHMSKGSLYYYFSDKDELIAAIFDESISELVDAIEGVAAEAETAQDALQTLYAEFSRRLNVGTPLALAMAYQFGGSSGLSMPTVTTNFRRAVKVIASQLDRAKAEGVIRADVDCMAAAVFSVGGLIATSMSVVSGSVGEDPEAVSASIMDMLVHGMGA